jgi:hypothetical protein
MNNVASVRTYDVMSATEGMGVWIRGELWEGEGRTVTMCAPSIVCCGFYWPVCVGGRGGGGGGGGEGGRCRVGKGRGVSERPKPEQRRVLG